MHGGGQEPDFMKKKKTDIKSHATVQLQEYNSHFKVHSRIEANRFILESIWKMDRCVQRCVGHVLGHCRRIPAGTGTAHTR